MVPLFHAELWLACTVQYHYPQYPSGCKSTGYGYAAFILLPLGLGA